MRIPVYALLVAAPLISAAEPPRVVKQFESSAFCRKYHCVLSGPIEPLRMHGTIREYFYNYRAHLPDGTLHPAQFGLRVTTSGYRGDPYLIVRWVPVHEFSAKDVVGINELVSEITGHPDFDAAAFVLRHEHERSAQEKPGDSDPVPVGAYNVSCTYSRGQQVTLLIETGPSIGTATMAADGTIILWLRAVAGSGAVGEGQLTYRKGDKDYDKILEHLGGLQPGESKPVPPWP